jgi:segregation and condensation protein B
MAKKTISEDLAPKLQVEALLFSSGRTISEEQLATLTGMPPLAVRTALSTLQKEYDGRESAISIFNDPTGWKMMVRDKYVSVVKNIIADTELSRATMETLAVIAYKYPKVLQSEVIDIRGSGAYEHMTELERLGFINREPSGRSFAVKLTEKFFNYFDVAGGKDIREVFKNVKVPRRVVQDGQKTLGDLQVVEVPKEHHDKVMEGMQVVDVPPPIEKPAAETREEIAENSPQTAPQEEENNTFLEDLDRRIAKLTEHNDEHDQDELLKRRPLPGIEQKEEDQAEKENSSETNQ